MRVWFPFLRIVLVAFVSNSCSRGQPNGNLENSHSENQVSGHQLEVENLPTDQSHLSRLSRRADATTEDGKEPLPVFRADATTEVKAARDKQRLVVLFPDTPSDHIPNESAEEDSWIARFLKKAVDLHGSDRAVLSAKVPRFRRRVVAGD